MIDNDTKNTGEGEACVFVCRLIGKGAFSSCPFAKNTASNAYQCTAFFNSDEVVVTHPH